MKRLLPLATLVTVLTAATNTQAKEVYDFSMPSAVTSTVQPTSSLETIAPESLEAPPYFNPLPIYDGFGFVQQYLESYEGKGIPLLKQDQSGTFSFDLSITVNKIGKNRNSMFGTQARMDPRFREIYGDQWPVIKFTKSFR